MHPSRILEPHLAIETLMFFLLGTIILGIVAWYYLACGPRWAIVVACGCALLLPCWVALSVGPTIFNLRSWCCLLALAITLWSLRILPGGLVLSDVIVFALVASQIVTERAVGDLSGSTWLTILLEWLAPYLLGRIALESADDVKRLTAMMAWVCLTLSMLAILESVTRHNLPNMLLGRTGSMQGEFDIRWGLKRAEGPTSHPIFFGLMLVMFLPWAMEAARRARLGDGPQWWLATPWLTGIAACCSMSRGPQLGVLMFLGLMSFLRRPAWRRSLLGAGVVAAVTGAFAYEPIMDLLHVWSNENRQAKLTILIGGEAVEYSGTNHRLLQLTVYRDAALNAGWSGYGLMRMSRKPSTIPHVEEHLREMFFSIDNHYLWMLLRGGFGGVGLFLLLGFTTLGNLLRPALRIDAPHGALACGLISSILTVMLMTTTVFFAMDFGFVWLFSLGVSGSLRKVCEARSATAVGPFIRPRLVPGHPVSLSGVAALPG